MSVVEAKAHIEIQSDALGQVIRRRLTEGDISLDNVVKADDNGEVKVQCESMDELENLLMAIENQDEEAVKQYLVEE